MFSVRLARMIDTYAGLPICVTLNLLRTGWRAVRRFTPRDQAGAKPDAVRKILVIKFFGIGSIILGTPFLRSLRKAYPQADLSFLTYNANKDVLELYPMVHRVFTLPTDRGIVGFLFGVPILFCRLWRQHFDLVVDLEFFSYFTAIVTYATGCRLTLGYKSLKQAREPFYSHAISCDGSVHVSKLALKFCDALGITPDGEDLEPPMVPDHARESLRRKLVDLGASMESNILSVNINASSLAYSRRWPKEHFAAVLSRAGAELDCAIVLIGARSDRAYVRDFLEEHPELPAFNTAGLLTIPELAALLERSRLFFTNDSGPLHLACALGVPTVSIFGPETPATYGPRGSQHKVFYANVFCSPCLNVYDAKTSTCTDRRCVKCIPADAVYPAIAHHFPPRHAGVVATPVAQPEGR